jgi:site-specific recombinase XerD
MQPPPKKLLDQVRDAIRLKHYAYRTEETYVQWIRRYILFHNKRHPKEMGNAASEAFLTHLAVEGQVSASTQNQALSALLFLYREVLNLEIAALMPFEQNDLSMCQPCAPRRNAKDRSATPRCGRAIALVSCPKSRSATQNQGFSG